MIFKLRMAYDCLCGKKKLRLLHMVACKLNIHDDNWIFDPK
jgi:hypothetical protein